MASPSPTTSNPASRAATELFPVQLAIYDLSHGMARTLLAGGSGLHSAAVGGIDVIPHTGLVVYGREYFFGSGIQSEDPIEFRRSTGLQPLQVLPLGHTRVPRAVFEDWCAAQARSGGTYSASSYDLLQRNCNNFSLDASTQCLGVAADQFPAWILEVPRRFLSSPMGQMLRPMLENMRITHPAGAESVGVGGTATTASSTNGSTTTTVSAQADNDQPNPWANISAVDTDNKRTSKLAPKQEDTTTTTAAASPPLETPLLDSFTQPLVSNDTKTVDLCIQKLIAACDNNNNNNDKETLEQAAPLLKQLPLSNSSSSNTISTLLLTLEQTEKVAAILLKVLQHGASARTFALLLLRIGVLQYYQQQQQQQQPEESVCLVACLEWVQSALLLTNDSNHNHNHNHSPLSSAAARSTAWLVVSNAVAVMGRLPLCSLNDNDDENMAIIHAAVRDTAHGRPEVRQAATAFLYNVLLLPPRQQKWQPPKPFVNDNNNKEEEEEEEEVTVSDTVVGILCAMLELVGTDEADATTRLRGLMVLGRILKPTTADGVFEAAKQLVVDLGLMDALLPLVVGEATTPNKKDGGGQIQTLASELLQILQH